ncbi:MAG: DUF1552 domain-containing protein [Planctomycetia bacterium]|nr:DUF1552 domain-containing protein [Planctomycetia bacterium]
MKPVHFVSSRTLSRRAMLRASGVSLALPLLDAMTPAFAAAPSNSPPKRMLAICTNMGILSEYFTPQAVGENYEATPYLKLLDPFRRDKTVFSGVSHPEVDGGHDADNCFLTAAPHPHRGGFKNSISLDQYIAAKNGHQTRFPSITIVVGPEQKRSLSWTGGGVMIPGELKPSRLFAKLFLQGSAQEVGLQVARLREGRSIMDAVADRSRELQRTLSGNDRNKLDQYFTSVRELENRLKLGEEWERKPKITVQVKPPVDIADNGELIGKTKVMFDLARLALETDSTRLVTILVDQATNAKPNIEGVTVGTHSLTHQSGSPVKREELKLVEEAQFRELARLLEAMKRSGDSGTTLLDDTVVLYGSQLGNAGLHTNTNMPMLLFGGGFRHGRHLAFDRKNNLPLCNLYVSVLQKLGIQADRFASSTGTMSGLS